MHASPSRHVDPALHIDDLDVGDLDDAIAHAEPALACLAGASLFVTGGTGFIGRWLLSVLARANATRGLDVRITVLTRSAAGFAQRCPQLASNPAIRCIEGDVRTFEFPKGSFSHVIHAATDTSVDADRQPLQLIDTIIDGTRRVLEFSHAACVKRVLFLSSGAVYGPQPRRIGAMSEDDTVACATTDRKAVYGQAKRLAEQIATVFHTDLALDVVIGRLFAFVGPGMPLDAHFAIGNFIRDAVAGRQIVVKSDGTPVRSYLHAGDLAAWLLRLLTDGQGGRVYNVGSDIPVALGDLAALVARTVPGAQGYAIKGTPSVNAVPAPYVPVIARARDELGLDVWTPLDEAIRRTARWVRPHPQGDEPRSGTGRGATSGEERKLVFVVDIDGVIAGLTPKNEYSIATPLPATIAKINRLYDSGHRIVLYTARGSATGLDWSSVTRQQMADWGVRYHEIRFGKPAADFYVDDRALSIADFHQLVGVTTGQTKRTP